MTNFLLFGILIGIVGVGWALGDILKELRKISAGDFLREPINSYGEGIGDAIQGQLVRGMAGISQYDHK